MGKLLTRSCQWQCILPDKKTMLGLCHLNGGSTRNYPNDNSETHTWQSKVSDAEQGCQETPPACIWRENLQQLWGQVSTSSGLILVGTSILYAGFALLVYPEMMSTSLASTHFATLLLTRTCVARWVSFNMTTSGTKLSMKTTRYRLVVFPGILVLHQIPFSARYAFRNYHLDN